MGIYAGNPLQKAWATMSGKGKEQEQLDKAAAESYGKASDPTANLPSVGDMFGKNPQLEQGVIQPIKVENPYAQPATQALGKSTTPDFSQAQMTAAQQSDFARALQGMYGQGAGAVGGLIGQLQRQTQGDFGAGGSLAQAMLRQGLGQSLADVQSQMASTRGLSPAAAAQLGARQAAQLQGQATQQAGILGLQQQLAAQQQLGQLGMGAAQFGGGTAAQMLGQARGQDIAQAQAISDADLKRLQLLTSSDVAMKQLQAQTGMGGEELKLKIALANQAAAAGDRALAAQLLGGLMGAGAQVGAAAVAAYDGGRIDGEPQVDGDSPKNDTVPAMLSPGEIVIPRSAAQNKNTAKAFLEALDGWDEKPSYAKVLKARRKK